MKLFLDLQFSMGGSKKCSWEPVSEPGSASGKVVGGRFLRFAGPGGSARYEVIHRQDPIRPMGTPFPHSRPALILGLASRHGKNGRAQVQRTNNLNQ
jgi:hypothetical protein